MNILDLLKKLFAIFTVVSMVLACIAKPFLMLLAGGDESAEPSHRIGSGFNCNGYDCSGFNCNGFTCSGDSDY